jgi:thiol-disulfide isomerase/thioredoxin
MKRYYFSSWFAVIAVGFLGLACAAVAQEAQLAQGQKAPAFQAKSLDNKPINFPGDYKGKLVLVDFWATWCPPCRGEIPNVVAAYEKFHSEGLEILGVTLDNAEGGSTLPSFLQKNKMTWPQVFEGKGWDCSVPRLYGINSIPSSFLVDGRCFAR